MPKKSTKLTAPEIPNETWHALYEAADALGELRLWECMGNADLLGVDDPRTGEPLLGAVMGALGEVFGIAIHHGPAGLRWVIDMATGDEPEPDLDAFLSIAVIKVEFVQKRELPSEDKLRLKALGFAPRSGRGARWPIFQSHKPGYVPWHIDEDDARLLLHALPRLAALGAALRPIFEIEDPLPAHGFAFWPAGRAPGAPLRAEEIEWRHVPMPPEPAPAPFSVDDATAARLAQFPQQPGLVIELDAFTGAGSIAKGGRPWAVKAALAAESRTGVIAGLDLGKSPADTLETTAGRALVMGIESLRARPGTVHVTKRGVLSALAPFAAQLGIQLVARRELPAVDEARAAMPPQFGFGV
jgi:hypothetical protein